MNGVIRRREAARQDLVTIAQRYVSEAGPRVADRFLAAAESTARRLAKMPGLGTRYEAEDPVFDEVRYCALPTRFKLFLIFYRPTGDGIEIVRVLHGARDLDGILAQEFGIGDEAHG